MNDTAEDILEESLMRRIDQILKADKNAIKNHYLEQEEILNTLEDDMRKKFEEFSNNLGTRTYEEYLTIYKAAFLDGLLLGHKAF